MSTHREADDPMVGAILCGKWTVLSPLGVGGTSIVYEARHRNGKRVAVKVLRPELAHNQAARSRFLREGYLSNRVAHPGVLAVLDDDVDEAGRPFLVTELLRGETLERRWKGAGRRLDAAEALRAADGVLAVLEAAHQAGIVHRDVKPGNVFLCDDGRVKLLDFGLARADQSASSTRSDATMGTPAFMAPEQARGHWDEVDPRSDLWSVGATLYALLGGSYVHARPSGNETLVAAATQRASSLALLRPDLPAPLIDAVDRALAFDKGRRYDNAVAMRQALREAAAALPSGREATGLPFGREAIVPPSGREAAAAPPLTLGREAPPSGVDLGTEPLASRPTRPEEASEHRSHSTQASPRRLARGLPAFAATLAVASAALGAWRLASWRRGPPAMAVAAAARPEPRAWSSEPDAALASCSADALESPACGASRWSGPVPFRFVDGTPACDPSQADTPQCFRNFVQAAMNRWCWATNGEICFRPWTSEARPVTIGARPGACYAEGLDGPEPKVWLDPAGQGACDAAGYAHVFGHVLGLGHPHQRRDRDRYLDFAPARVAPACRDEVSRVCAPDTGPAGPFDYASVMTYLGAGPFPFTDKIGNAPPTPSKPSPQDASLALELNASHAGWQPFTMLGEETAPSAPLDPKLPGGHTLVGSPAAVVARAPATGARPLLHLIVLGDDGHLYEKTTPSPWASGPGARFSATPWVDLGGGFDSDAAVAWQPGRDRIDVVARRGDGQLYHRPSAGPEPAWAAVGAPPPGAASAPGLASSDPDRLDVVVRGGDDALWLRTLEKGIWKNWMSLGYAVEGKPAMASWGYGRLDVVAKAKGTPQLLHLPRDRKGYAWCREDQDWWCEVNYNYPVAAEGPSPAVVATRVGGLEVFLKTPNSFLSQMHHPFMEWEHRWYTIGGIPHSDPAAAVWPDGVITVYVFGSTPAAANANATSLPVLLERSWRP